MSKPEVPAEGQFWVSMVKDASSTVTRKADTTKIIAAIQSGRWRVQAETIRATFSSILAETADMKAAKGAVDALKKKLPAFMPSGQFSSRETPADQKLVEYSGLLCADLDDLGARLPEVRTKLIASPHLVALFISPGGHGLKAIFRVAADAAMHTTNFRAVEHHVCALCGEKIDQSRKDLAGMCFVSYDPDAFWNPNATELPLPPEEEKPKEKSPTIFCAAPEMETRRRIAEELVGTIQWDSETHGFCQCPGQHLHTTGNGHRDCEIHLDRAPTIHCFHGHCKGMLTGVNHELRSRIAKAENAPAPVQSRNRVAPQYGLTDDCPTLDALPYTPPPLDLFPAALQDYVLAASDALAVDTSYIFLPVLSALGTAVGNARVVQLKPGFVQPPIFWTGIIGRSGSKKTPSQDEALFGIHAYERQLLAKNRRAMQKHNEALAQWEEASRPQRGPKPIQPCKETVLLDDLTLASLATALNENPRGVLVKKDELSHWFASFDQYHQSRGADVSRWLSLHSGVLFALDRKTDRESFRLFDPRVCISGGIQPKILGKCLTEDFFDRGLPARFLFAFPPSRHHRWTEKTVPERLRAEVLQIFGKLFALTPDEAEDGQTEPKVLSLSPDAKSEFISFYDKVASESADADEHEEFVWHKLTGYAARLALIGELVRGDAATASGEVMRAATALARWCGEEASRIYRLLAEDRETTEVRRLAEFIAGRGGTVTVRDIITNYRPLKNRTEMAEYALHQLAASGMGEWLPMTSTPKGGQPRRPFRVFAQTDPRLHLQNRPNALKTEGIADADNSDSAQIRNEVTSEVEIAEGDLIEADLI